MPSTSRARSARVASQGLFRRAQHLLGDAGIVDVTVLMGWFTIVSLTLRGPGRLRARWVLGAMR